MNRKKIAAVIGFICIFLAGYFISTKVMHNTTVNEKLDAIDLLIDQYYLEDTKDIDKEEGIYKGYVEQLDDPYSQYYTKEEYEQLLEETSGNYGGIGVMISQNQATGGLDISQIFDKSPAKKEGMQIGDSIIKVEGKSIANMELQEAISMIKGKEGTKVKLTVQRKDKEMEFVLTREKVEAERTTYKMLDNNIGMITVSEFIANTSEQFQNALDELNAQGMEALILDLRSNPGGSLDQVVAVADCFLPKGKTIVSVKNKKGKEEVYQAKTEQEFQKPMVVLVDEYSASASEILTGVIKDYKLGTVIGKKTFGKGIVQRIFPFSDGSAVKLTISSYYTPNGICVQGTGIEPDIEVEQKDKKDMNTEKDPVLKKAIEVLQK